MLTRAVTLVVDPPPSLQRFLNKLTSAHVVSFVVIAASLLVVLALTLEPAAALRLLTASQGARGAPCQDCYGGRFGYECEGNVYTSNEYAPPEGYRPNDCQDITEEIAKRVAQLQKPYDCYKGFGQAAFRQYNLHPNFSNGLSVDPYTLVAQALNALTETFMNGYAMQFSPRFSLTASDYDPFCHIPATEAGNGEKGTYVGLACFIEDVSPCDAATQSRLNKTHPTEPATRVTLTSINRADVPLSVEQDKFVKDEQERIEAFLSLQPVELTNPPAFIDTNQIPEPYGKRGIHWLQVHLLKYMWRETPRFAALVKATADANGLSEALKRDKNVVAMYMPACTTDGQTLRESEKEKFLERSRHQAIKRPVACRSIAEYFAAANVLREKRPELTTVLLVTSDLNIVSESTAFNADAVEGNGLAEVQRNRRSANYDPSVNLKRKYKWNVLYGLMRPNAGQAGLLQSGRTKHITDVKYQVDEPGNEATRAMVSLALMARCTHYVGIFGDIRGQLAYKMMVANKRGGAYVPYISLDQATPQPSFDNDRFAVQAKEDMSHDMRKARLGIDMPRSGQFHISTSYG